MIYVFIGYLVVVNFLTFVLFGIDKFKSVKQSFRISEKMLLNLTAAGGFLGGLLGMIAFSHKTIKSSFQILFFVIVFAWIILLFVLSHIWHNYL